MPKANEVKNVKKTAEADLKKVEKVAEVKVEPAKTIETKTAEVKAPVKEAEVKAPVEKKAAEKKTTTTKKAAEKKTTTTKKAATTKKVKESVCIQYAGNEVEVTDIIAKAKEAYGDAEAIKEIKVYVKPEEGMAYYVVNGDATGSVAL